MEWNDLPMSSRSELMSIYLKNGITSLDEMKKHYNSFAEGGFTSPSYPPFNNIPKRTDIYDNEKRARGKWHVENAKGNPNSVITKAFNEAKSKGLTTEQAYEYVADVAKQHGWSKEGSILVQRTIPYKASPNITISDNNVSPKYITSEPMSEKEYQRRKDLQVIRESQQIGNRDVIYDSDEKVKRDNPNNPRTPFEPHPITPKEMDVTLKGLRFLQPFDPTGLTGVPDFLMSVASGKDIGINFIGMLPAIGKVKAVENGSRLARFNNSLMDTGEEVLGNLIGRVSPRVGNFINTTTSAVQDITSKPAEKIVKQLMQKRGTQAANRFVTGWNLGATTANFGRAGEDIYDFFTEDPLVQRVKEGFQFAEGGNLYIPPERFFGIATPEVTDNNIYYSRNSMLPEVKVVDKGDPRKVNNDYYKAHSRARADLQYKVQTAPGWQLATLGAALPAAFMLTPTVLPAVGKVLTNPLVDTALTTHGVITAPKNIVEGVNEIKEGNYGKGALNLGLTALDLIGAGNLIGRPARLLSKNFRRNLAYRTIFPYDYSFSPKDAKDILKGIWNKQYSPKDIQHVHENHPLRAAAFRKYLGLEDDITKKLFVPRSDGTFNIDPEVAIELNKNVGINTLTGSPLQNLYKGYKRDNIYDIMGGLGGSEVYSLGNRGVFRMTDTWDLQPFKKFEGSPRVRLANDIENLGTKIRQHTYDKSLLKPIDKLAEKMQYAGDYVKADKSANSWLRNFEVGPILGGKPFNIDARIPININGGFPIYNPIANIPSLEQAIMTKGDKVVFRRVKEPFEQFANGGPIHIKPENRGKFTALKKRTGHSASWFKEHGTPAQKKMAVFELNSKKWSKR